jgi:hypothetical protein
MGKSYVYLEIGSHLGGSIQSHLLDPRCRRIYSIDKRPAQQPDDRGPVFHYEGNSTDRMLNNLRALSGDGVSKVVCFDTDARDLAPHLIDDIPDLCFIDGEHTRTSVLNDFAFCLRVCSPHAVIYFHDDSVVHAAIREIIRLLRKDGREFRAIKLQGLTFAIALGNGRVAEDERVKPISRDGWRALRRMRLRAFVKRLLPARLLPVARYVAHRLPW